MSDVTYNFRLEKTIRDRAFAVIRSQGMTPSQALRMFLTQTAENNQIPLSLNYERKFSASTLEAINELQNNDGKTYENLEDFLQAKANEQQGVSKNSSF